MRRTERLREVERELFKLTKAELKDRFLSINVRMGDYRNRLDKAALVRLIARQIVNKEGNEK